MNPLTQYLAAHHAQIAYTLGGIFMVLNFTIKIALRFHPIEDWVLVAERYPRIAAIVRLLEALGISPISAIQSVIDFIRNEASPGTIAAAQALKVSASRPVIAPRGAALRQRVTPTDPTVVISAKPDVEELQSKVSRGLKMDGEDVVVITVKEAEEILAFIKAHT